MIVLLVSIMLLVPGLASARTPQHLHGLVLGLSSKTGEVVVRHNPFGGMPAMTMPFRVVPATDTKKLLAGATIDADVDTSTEPWTLTHVVASGAQPLTDQSIMERVTPLRVGDVVPDQAFLDQRGQPFSFAQLRGQDVVLAFIYTRCQDPRMCPLISGKFHALQGLLGSRKAHLVEVTLDPTYDRPKVLARYGRVFGANPAKWTLAVGSPDADLRFAARFGVSTFPDPNIGIIHAEDTALIGPDGRVNEMITDTSWAPSEIIAQLDANNGLASNPIARFNLWLSKTASAVCGNAVGQFSGLRDLIIVIVLIGGLAYLARRLWTSVFAEKRT
jgi:protein SCO1/2